MVKKARVVKIDNARGGDGSIEMHHFLEGEELLGQNAMFAKVVVKPNSSIGWHQHVGDTEPYAIIKGEGTFIDSDGTKTVVVPGDVCCINVGDHHSLENHSSSEDLEIIALVINDPSAK
ncbi:MAG: cupin domain-containing protein [Bacillota bacterium]